MFDFRFYEIYRSSEYMDLLLDGILISSSLTIISGILGFIIAFTPVSYTHLTLPTIAGV